MRAPWQAVRIGAELHFLSGPSNGTYKTGRQIIQSERRASDVYIRGTVWWDGPDPGGMHRPGEVVC